VAFLTSLGSKPASAESRQLHSIIQRQQSYDTVKTARFLQESRALARKSRDVAAVLFGLKFADNIPGDPKKRNPGFNFAITSVNVHRFQSFFTVTTSIFCFNGFNQTAIVLRYSAHIKPRKTIKTIKREKYP